MLFRSRWRAETLSTDQPRPTVSLLGSTDAEISAILGADISKRVRLMDTGGLYPSQVDGLFAIEAARVRSRVGTDLAGTWVLASEDVAMANFFRVSSNDASADGWPDLKAKSMRSAKIS